MSALDLRRFHNMLFGTEPATSFAEIRHTRQGRSMGQVFLGVREVEQWARTVEKLSGTGNVYVGVCPRSERRGTADVVPHGHVLWVDCDSPESIAASEAFAPVPSMIVDSGGGRHLYWALGHPLPAAEIERGNRRLVRRLGADPKCIDIARIMRVPNTLNQKYDAPRPVTVLSTNVEVFSFDDVVGTLADPPAGTDRSRRINQPRERVPGDDSVGAQDAAVALIGRYSPGSDLRPSGKDRLHGHCPFEFHDDRNPSFGLFPDGGYICSCGTGDIVRLFVNLRGEEFTDCDLPRYRRELREELGLGVAA
jgi:hypothetical protein